jgi:peroxiredoxin
MGSAESDYADLENAFAAHAARLAEIEFPLALGVDDRAPDFALPNARGQLVRLGDLLQQGPVVLVFYRGVWCPYCNRQLRALQEIIPGIRERGASLVAISPQTPDNSLTMVEKNELSFEVLSDVNSYVAADYGIMFSFTSEERGLFLAVRNDLTKVNGHDSWVLPAPSVFVVDGDRRVRHAHIDGDFTRRMEPAEVLRVLEAL